MTDNRRVTKVFGAANKKKLEEENGKSEEEIGGVKENVI